MPSIGSNTQHGPGGTDAPPPISSASTSWSVEAFGNQPPEHPLDRQIDLGDEIDGPLLVDTEIAAEARHLDVAGANDRFDGGGQKQRIVGHERRLRIRSARDRPAIRRGCTV